MWGYLERINGGSAGQSFKVTGAYSDQRALIDMQILDPLARYTLIDASGREFL